jgi:hypothetical protein
VTDWSIDFFDYSSFYIANGSPEGVAFSSLIEYRGGSNNTVYSSGDPIGLPTTFYAPNPTYDISDYTSYQGVVEFGPNFQFELAAPATVPEPSSALLLGLGAATLIRRRRFRRRSSDRNDS